jgi:hypothetical protein
MIVKDRPGDEPVKTIAVLLLGVPLAAGDYAVLESGFRLRVDRYETSGGTIRLYHGEGVTELPASAVIAFEPEDYRPPPVRPKPAPPPPPSPRELVERAARRWGLPPEILHSVAEAESGYRQDAVSPKGALGIMQLMPSTSAELGSDPADPAGNVDAGARYLRGLLLRYDGGLYRALAAYNAGPGAVDRHGGVPPYPETQLYVQRVVERWLRRGGLAARPPGSD